MELLLGCISLGDMSRALRLGKKGLSRLWSKYPDELFLSHYRLGIEYKLQPQPGFSFAEIFIQILALLAFHTNRSRKISRLPCALGDITIGTSNQQTKEMEAMF